MPIQEAWNPSDESSDATIQQRARRQSQRRDHWSFPLPIQCRTKQFMQHSPLLRKTPLRLERSEFLAADEATISAYGQTPAAKRAQCAGLLARYWGQAMSVFVEPPRGFEPRTYALRVGRSHARWSFPEVSRRVSCRLLMVAALKRGRVRGRVSAPWRTC